MTALPSCRWLAFSALLAGCTSNAAPPPSMDALIESADVASLPAPDLWYVMDTLLVDDDTNVALARGTHGFDLDGQFTRAASPRNGPGCGQEDYYSTLDLDQNCAVLGAAGGCAQSPGASIGFDSDAGAMVGGHGGVDNGSPRERSSSHTALRSRGPRRLTPHAPELPLR